MKSRFFAVSAIVFSLSLFATTAATGQYLRVYYPDIEQGSATLVVSPTGQALLVDAGSGLDVVDEAIEDFVNDLIDAGVVTSLDYTVATHYDEDHIGRMENVFQLVPMPGTAIAYDRGTFSQVPGSFAYSDYAFSAGFHNRTTITPNTTINLGGGVTVRAYVVNGDLPDGTSVDISGSGQFENSTSVAVVVEYGDVEIFIGGDLTGNPDAMVTDVESEVAPFVGDVDVYTFNHHGSRTSSNAFFLSLLKAETGINQNAANNGFGHPNTEVVNRFLGTLDTAGNTPLFFQQNPGNPTDTRSDDSLAAGIADCDDVDSAIGMPGTITLFSDGTSYEIQGCGFGALTRPADEGVATLGDYPPAILSVSQSPSVPLSTQSATVTAEVDDVSTPSVQLRWWLDGVEQTPIAMTSSGGVVYTGSIPAQLDGARVRYRVEATDSLSQSELSRAHGYFSGITPISTLRLQDTDGILVPKAYGARVQANVTAEPGLFHTFVTQAYLQDATGGLQLFDGDLLNFQRGDLVEVIGELEQFGGQVELNSSEPVGDFGATLIGPSVAPAPQVVTVSQVGEATEGSLIRINGLTVVGGTTIPQTGTGNLTVSDDGGVTTLTVRVDGDTDIPGANTPTGTFDLIGISSQFDSFAPYLSGYQILPRERADFITDEVNHSQVVISEIHADPDASNGDANGDGSISSTRDEFIELLNTGFTAVDISGWEIHDGQRLRHVFASGTILPAREATVVFGGGNPVGDFGNAAANGLVFTASRGRLALNNDGDTVTLFDDGGGTVQIVTYGSEGGDNQSLVRSPDFSNAPFVKHSVASGSGGSLYSPGTQISGQAFTVPAGAILITEVLYDPSGADGGLEWIELYNASTAPVDLSQMSLGAGGSNYTNTVVQLTGILAPGATHVVGGPTSSADNANPVFDQPLDWSPDLQNSGTTADGVALFNVSAALITATTVPVDAVVYGASNDNSLIDETGVANAPEVGDASGGASIERLDLAGSWQIQLNPNPNAFTPGGGPPPPPSGAGLVISEVFYDASSGDDGFEWVELYNTSNAAIDLSGFSLGNGGSSYTSSTVQLSGTIGAGQVFVVGGPTSDASNGNPSFDLVINFSPDFQNSGTVGDGVALFDVAASQITSSTVPIDAVIYGPNNDSGLIDETGIANAPEVGDAPAGSTIERTDLAGTWQIQATPTPNSPAF